MSEAESDATPIVTSSIGEALDFAASMLSGGIESEAKANPAGAVELVTLLARYVQFRYVGEFGLAYEMLEDLAGLCHSGGYRKRQVWSQLKWAAAAMGMAEALALQPNELR